jgi:hypothetical protein
MMFNDPCYLLDVPIKLGRVLILALKSDEHINVNLGQERKECLARPVCINPHNGCSQHTACTPFLQCLSVLLPNRLKLVG